jgi:demethylmenaquinone methyltransferase/2-methoxy-6-polyprenyl-1,4-benzoquinol methylase
MPHRDNLWLDGNRRQERYLTPERKNRKAYYGFEEIPASDKAARVRAHFDSVAHVYDFMNTVLSLGIHHLWKREAVAWMKLGPGHRVLDVAGGTGDLALLAARAAGEEGRVTIYDINWSMMSAGFANIRRAPAGNSIRWCQGDAERIAFADESFDAVMVGFGIRNVTRPEKGFAEMQRVLKPDGVLMCLEFSKPANPLFRWLYDAYSFTAMPILGAALAGSSQAYHHLSESIRTWAMPDDLSEMLVRVGLTEVRYRRLTNGIAVVHLAKKP